MSRLQFGPIYQSIEHLRVPLDGNAVHLEGASETVMGGDTLHAVEGVKVLVASDHVDSGSTLARGNGGIGQKEFPDLTHAY